MNIPDKIYYAAIADFLGGQIVIRTMDFYHVNIVLGPAQVASLEVALKKYMDEYGEGERAIQKVVSP